MSKFGSLLSQHDSSWPRLLPAFWCPSLLTQHLLPLPASESYSSRASGSGLPPSVRAALSLSHSIFSLIVSRVRPCAFASVLFALSSWSRPRAVRLIKQSVSEGMISRSHRPPPPRSAPSKYRWISVPFDSVPISPFFSFSPLLYYLCTEVWDMTGWRLMVMTIRAAGINTRV